jgi:hypothetical protein
MIQIVKQFPVLTVLFVVAVIASVRADSLEVPRTPAELAVPAGSDGLLAATTFIHWQQQHLFNGSRLWQASPQLTDAVKPY